MQYCYNSTSCGLVNGIIAYFEAGDETLATLTAEVLRNCTQSPTSIIWGGAALTKEEMIAAFQDPSLDTLSIGTLGIRFTVENEAVLLQDFLYALETEVPTLAQFASNVWAEIFGTAAQFQ